jgi:hypothetical protein
VTEADHEHVTIAPPEQTVFFLLFSVVSHCFFPFSVFFFFFLTFYLFFLIFLYLLLGLGLGALVVIVLATGPKPDRGRYIFKGDKNPWHDFLWK